MRLSPIIFGALLGLAQSSIIKQGLANDAADPSGSNSVDNKAAPPTSSAPPSQTSAPPDNSSSSDSGGSGGGSSSSSGGGGDDVTVTVTNTVTSNGAGSTVTKDVTTTSTSIKSVIATSTVFVTSTITATGNEETATRVVFSTTTVIVNMKRALAEEQLPSRTAPAQVEAVPTEPPRADGLERRWIEKRATVTVTRTVTVGAGGGTSTVTDTVTRISVSPTSSVTTVTSTITETEQLNAKTTITSTSVLTVTSTVVTAGVIESTTAPGSDPSATGGASNGGQGSGSGSSSTGISTGAKVGIGIGAGVGGLAILGIVLFLIMRRRDRGPAPDPDDLIGASEVPIGPSGRNPPTSGHSAAAASLLGVSRPVAKPVSPEGYRGTALGDGRAGFAKPDTFGPSYNVTPVSTTTSPVYNMTHTPEPISGAAELASDGGAASRWHDPSATEIDSQPVMSHRSGPVYEMPVQNYR